ncbi:MAG: DUF488 domain-containing protein [Acidobacteria bacterium]|nr:DUF488 domain-containing protein [Acidobacteriota bacterium]
MSTLFTIGHSNHELRHFLELLRTHGIEVVVDTRSAPYSKYTTQFNQEALKAALAENGFRYLYLGRELGGRPAGDSFYDEEGRVLYGKVAQSQLFLEGIERVLAGLAQYRIALMCAEEDPSDCHRRLLITRVLVERGLAVHHIRGDGRLQTEEDLRTEEQDPQLSLFDEGGDSPWRSTRSVLPRRAPSSSSES